MRQSGRSRTPSLAKLGWKPGRHAWAEMTKLLDRTWTHQNGTHLRLARLAIDTSYEAPAVYAWSRRQGVAAGFSDGNQGMQVAQFHVFQSHSAVIRSEVRDLHQFNLWHPSVFSGLSSVTSFISIDS